MKWVYKGSNAKSTAAISCKGGKYRENSLPGKKFESGHMIKKTPCKLENVEFLIKLVSIDMLASNSYAALAK